MIEVPHKVGCDNVHLHCSATDVQYVLSLTGKDFVVRILHRGMADSSCEAQLESATRARGL